MISSSNFRLPSSIFQLPTFSTLLYKYFHTFAARLKRRLWKDLIDCNHGKKMLKQHLPANHPNLSTLFNIN